MKNKVMAALLGVLLIIAAFTAVKAPVKPLELDFKDVASEEIEGRSGQEDRPPLRVAVSAVLSATDTISHYRTIASYLGAQLGRPAILIQRKSYAEVNLLMLNGGADVAFLTSGAFAAYEKMGEWEGLAVQERLGQPFYRAYLVVPKGSLYEKIGDLRGKSIAFSDPQSYSGHLYVAHQLLPKGEKPETYFGRIIYTYNHDKTLRAVAGRLVDAGAVDSLVYEYARLKNPELADSVRIIAESPTVGTGPVVAGGSLSQEARRNLRQALLAMHDDPAMTAAMQGLLIDRYVSFKSSYFDEIRQVTRERRERP